MIAPKMMAPKTPVMVMAALCGESKGVPKVVIS
jgi:hypothetical protein